LASLSLGVVLGPEAPLIALGAGLAGWAVRLARRPVPAQATAVVAAAGSFAAVSTLLGSPLLGAFLLMEASGLGGPTLGLVLVPGLVAAGVGSLIFIGLDAWTGLGTSSLALPDVPPFAQPDLAQFGWALVIGLGAAGGVTMSHLPGLPLVPGVAMGIGAMCVVMLRLPLTSVLLATLLLLSDGPAVMPLVIVAVAVAYAASARLTPAPAETPAAVPPAEGPVQASRTPAQRTVSRARGR
jgi:hypothetical protein